MPIRDVSRYGIRIVTQMDVIALRLYKYYRCPTCFNVYRQNIKHDQLSEQITIDC